MTLLPSWLGTPLAAHRSTYLRAGLAAVFTNLFALATSFYSLTVYNRIVPNNALSSLEAISIGMAIVLFFDFLMRMLRGYFVDVAAGEVDAELGDAMFKRLLAMRLSDRQASSGAFAGLLREFETLREVFASATLITLVDLPFILLFLVVIGILGGVIVVVPLLMIPLVILAALAVQPGLNRLAGDALLQSFSKQGVLVETVTALETVKAGRAGPMLEARWRQALTGNEAATLGSRLLAAFAANVAASAQQIAYVATVLLGVFLIAENRMTSGTLVAVSILAGRAVAPLNQVAALLIRLSATRAALKRLDSFMSTPGEQATHAQVRRQRLAGGLAFRNVSFRYPGSGQSVLQDASFQIEPGEKVAVIGRLGSGKSTVARLLLGLYEPDEGQVLIDGADLRQLDREDLRRNSGSVLQDIMLFSGTIRDNITLGASDIDDAELLRLAEISGTASFTALIPNGLDLRLADRGEGLSGGQRQSIAIARALAGRPPILILDEPTSAMDTQSEQALINSLRPEIADRTLLLVTHRRAMLQLVDRVIVVDRARIVADGPRDAVLQRLGRQS